MAIKISESKAEMYGRFSAWSKIDKKVRRNINEGHGRYAIRHGFFTVTFNDGKDDVQVKGDEWVKFCNESKELVREFNSKQRRCCPFCGGDSEMSFEFGCSDPDALFRIRCLGCGCRVTGSSYESVASNWERRSEAVDDTQVSKRNGECDSLRVALEVRNREIERLETSVRLLTEAAKSQTETNEKRHLHIVELMRTMKEISKSPYGEIYQLGLSDDDGNTYFGCAVKFDEANADKMPRVGHGDMFAVVPYPIFARVLEECK